MHKRKVTKQDKNMANKDELEHLTTSGMVEIAISENVAGDNAHPDGVASSRSDSGMYVTHDDISGNKIIDEGTVHIDRGFSDSTVPLSRGIVEDVAGSAVRSVCCGCIDRAMTIISVILGVLVIVAGGILLYQGTVATTGFNYVLWTF